MLQVLTLFCIIFMRISICIDSVNEGYGQLAKLLSVFSLTDEYLIVFTKSFHSETILFSTLMKWKLTPCLQLLLQCNVCHSLSWHDFSYMCLTALEQYNKTVSKSAPRFQSCYEIIVCCSSRLFNYVTSSKNNNSENFRNRIQLLRYYNEKNVLCIVFFQHC